MFIVGQVVSKWRYHIFGQASLKIDTVQVLRSLLYTSILAEFENFYQHSEIMLCLWGNSAGGYLTMAIVVYIL